MSTRADRALVAVSGSFRSALTEVAAAVEEFTTRGALVLSPGDPTVVDAFGTFVFVASDELRAARLVQERHFSAIELADLLWVAAPRGYIGVSTAMEIQHALIHQIPVYMSEVPNEVYIRQVVNFVSGPTEALSDVRLRRGARPGRDHGRFLIDPYRALEMSQATLDRLASELARSSRWDAAADAPEVRRLLNNLRRQLALPADG